MMATEGTSHTSALTVLLVSETVSLLCLLLLLANEGRVRKLASRSALMFDRQPTARASDLSSGLAFGAYITQWASALPAVAVLIDPHETGTASTDLLVVAVAAGISLAALGLAQMYWGASRQLNHTVLVALTSIKALGVAVAAGGALATWWTASAGNILAWPVLLAWGVSLAAALSCLLVVGAYLYVSKSNQSSRF